MIKRLFAYYLEDGKYDATLLEDTLKEALGSDSMFGSVSLRPSGLKFAVTATTISNATLCLITNYNGEGDVSKGLRMSQKLHI